MGRYFLFSKQEPEEYEDIEGFICPGLVDTHIHGYKNQDIMDAKKGALNIISKGLLECGITSFLPTTLTDSVERLVGKEYKEVQGVKVRGIFLEVPFFYKKFISFY